MVGFVTDFSSTLPVSRSQLPSITADCFVQFLRYSLCAQLPAVVNICRMDDVADCIWILHEGSVAEVDAERIESHDRHAPAIFGVDCTSEGAGLAIPLQAMRPAVSVCETIYLVNCVSPSAERRCPVAGLGVLSMHVHLDAPSSRWLYMLMGLYSSILSSEACSLCLSVLFPK